MDIDLDLNPEPITVEVEVTNHCNASCIFCPRSKLIAPLGMMTVATFGKLIDQCMHYRADLRVNCGRQTAYFPTITFSGLGEPLLNPLIYEFIAHANQYGFETRLITNGAFLDEKTIVGLLNAGLKRLSISFVGIEKQAYEESMRNLEFERALRNVECVVAATTRDTLSVAVMFSRNRLVRQTDEEIVAFWQKRGVDRVVIGCTPHNRGGLLAPNELWAFDPDWRIDYTRKNWCNRLLYVLTVCWNGDIVLCCHDYLTKSAVLGNVHTHSLKEIDTTKSGILERKVRYSLCQPCNEPFAFQSESYIREWIENEYIPARTTGQLPIAHVLHTGSHMG